MNKKLFLSALASTALLASCVENDLGSNDALSGNSDGRISFTQKNTNMTRATPTSENLEDKSHYEFGVFGAYEGLFDPTGENNIFKNLLVSYKNENHYTGVAGGNTYGEDAGGSVETVAGKGISSWFYDGLTVANSKAMVDQYLRYWDLSTTKAMFLAYAPYQNTFSYEKTSADKINFSWERVGTVYENAVAQPAGIIAPVSTTANPITAPTETDKINSNEVIYTKDATSHLQSEYTTHDVPLTFKHANAKIKIGFYEVIPGYTVKILNLIPTEATSKIPGTPAAYEGVALTPATHTEAYTLNETTNNVGTHHYGNSKYKYYDHAAFAINDVTTTSVESAVRVGLSGDAKEVLVNDNWRFKTPEGEIGTTNPTATLSSSSYIALPNHNGTDYSTLASTAVQSIVQNTGFTLHVTYELIPSDGTKSVIVYDARCFVPAENCQWQAGKQYTYIFKITRNSNGTTDPSDLSNDIFDDTDTSNPYIDPEDPRIPEDPSLIPIVFDGINIVDYDVPSSNVEGNDHIISDATTWKKITKAGTTDFRVSPYLLTAADYKETIKDYTTAPMSEFTSNSFDYATRAFTFVGGSNVNDVTLTASAQSTTTVDLSSRTITGPATAYWDEIKSTKAAVSVPTYTVYVWNVDGATAANSYTAKPNAADIVINGNESGTVIDNYAYDAQISKVVYDALSAAAKLYYKVNTLDDTKYDRIADGISSSDYSALDASVQACYELVGSVYKLKKVAAADYSSLTALQKSALVVSDTHKTYEFSYALPTAPAGWTITTATDATPSTAYGFVKK